MSAGIGASPKKTPPAVATPFPPPFPSRKIGLTWPMIAATPNAMAHKLGWCCRYAEEAADGGSNPFRISAR